MPEGPEVQKTVNGLNDLLGGKTLLKIEIVGGRFLKSGIARLNEIRLPFHNTRFHCKGKFIYWSFSEQAIFFSQLGMTGSFGEQNKHSAIKFQFNTREIFFNDIRRFGSFKVGTKTELEEKLSSLGWDILQEEIPADIVTRLRKLNNKTIAEALLNQNQIAGCGNYIKNECLYRAKVHPLRLVSNLTDVEIFLICGELSKIAKESYLAGGATIVTFKDINGQAGKYAEQFKVYRRKTDPYGNSIKRITTKDGRSTYFVEGVQK